MGKKKGAILTITQSPDCIQAIEGLWSQIELIQQFIMKYKLKHLKVSDSRVG